MNKNGNIGGSGNDTQSAAFPFFFSSFWERENLHMDLQLKFRWKRQIQKHQIIRNNVKIVISKQQEMLTSY